MEKEVQIGQLVAGKYRIEQVLGRGGMGVVMAALHEQLNQRVALKFLTDNAYQHPEAVARFLREARSAVQIQSEHVARVMDVGTLESGAPYMVMEYLRGRDLKEVSTRRGPLPVIEAVDYVLQACDALAEAHALGIVHRDLKPSNLFLTERLDGSPLVKVLDFGISKALHKGDTSQMQMTASAAIMGSPQYMSPEQIRSSKNVDARADVWALGTILHELLTGSPAYVADTVPGLLAMIVADAPPPLSASRPDAPLELEAAILRCLQKDRDQRFANVSEFARSIERFASNDTRTLVKRIARVLGDNAPPPSISTTASSLGGAGLAGITRDASGHGSTNGTWAHTGRISQGAVPIYQRPSILLGAVLGVAGIAFGGWFLLRSAPSATAAPAGTATAVVAAQPSAAAPEHPRAEVAPAPPEPTTPRPTVGVVRSAEPEPAPKAEPERQHEAALNEPLDDELFVKEAKGSVEDDSSRAKRRATASPTRTERARPPSVRPRSSSSGARSSSDEAPPAAAQPAAPKKNTNTLDLFNDTK